MEFGMFHEFQRRPGQTEAEAFSESFEQVDQAEAAGLDVMWLAELHNAPERSVLAAPLNIASAIAMRTRRMKIGIAVQVLPLCHPLRIAEEAATVDHISHGRLIFGVGRSGFPRTYQAYGISYAESRERFAEVLEILKRAWTQETFSFHGQFYNFENICLVPKPYQAPYPELRIAVNSPDTFQQSGEAGIPIFVATRLGDLNELVPNLRVYREAWAEAGHPGQGKVYLRVPVYIAATEKQAREEPHESVMFFYKYLGERIEASATQEGARAIENRAERGQRLLTIDYEEVLKSKIVVGTPAMVTDRLATLKETLGLSGILAEMNCGMRIPHERVVNSLQLMCGAVMPHLRE
ncbi:MAG: LLM class flavin-dependent oxidoreductase [Rhodopila sp.]|jgi:alkanesulfonate monooxygenase SsuD/methylene tetrahydromethanopterin reductase-like flavin-dependent oxidoreductase (luciferase family)